MKVRIKYEKTGVMKFVGHLDMTRYFQKALRRAGIDVRFSDGFSPHMIMSFAAPLGVGLTSTGEYMDLDLRTPVTTSFLTERLNAQMVEGVRILDMRRIEEGRASKAMSLVAAADYEVDCPALAGMEEGALADALSGFLALPEIPAEKKTKHGSAVINLRPLIYRAAFRGRTLCMRVSCGSTDNLRPELVMSVFLSHLGISADQGRMRIHRCEVYADTSREGEAPAFVPLGGLGTVVTEETLRDEQIPG